MNATTKQSIKIEIAEQLKPILADQFIIYVKARNYHWNITGDLFFVLHEKFQELYEMLQVDIDVIAERIRTLDVFAPGTLEELKKLSEIKDENSATYPNQTVMTKNIISDLEFLSARINHTAAKLQKDYQDETTASILYGLAEKYDKFIWMLKSLNLS
jgi:starvation-inducible DNA-binding protein